MAFTNNLKLQVDLPVWEWCRFAPAATTAVSSMTTGNGLGNKYLYYQLSNALYRYDTRADSWHQLASVPVTTPTIMNNNVLSNAVGHYGQAIAGGASTIQIAGLSGSVLVDYKIRILSGTGAGQERTITAVSAPTVHDRGVVTTASGTAVIDASVTGGIGFKQWKANIWKNYQVRIDFGTGRTQVRPILYNTLNTLTFSYVNHITINRWANVPLAVNTAVGSLYVIESHQVTVDVAWDTAPDATSNFVILSGGIWNITQGTTATPFFSFAYYDRLSDVWYQKSTQSGLKTVVFLAASDLQMERFTESGGAIVSGTATAGGNNTLTNTGVTMIANQYINMTLTITGGTGSGQTRNILSHTSTVFTTTTNWVTNPDATSTYTVTGGQIISGIASAGAARSLTDSTLSMTPMQYANFELRIVFGTGRGQNRSILSNTATVFNVTNNWDTMPDATSVYALYRDVGKIFLIGGNDAGMLQYSQETDQWTTGKQLDDGQCNQLASTKSGQEPIALTSITRTATSMVTAGTVSTAGTGYNVDDLLTVDAKGGIVRVLTVDSTNGAVLTVSLETCGTGYTTGAKATVASPVTGTGCQITLGASDIDFTELALAPIAHNYKIGDTVTISGANGATAAEFNGTYTILGIPAPTTNLSFSYCSVGDPGAATATIPNSPSTTQLVDCTKNWAVNEHVGKLVQLSSNVVLSVGQVRRIVSNTATTLVWTLAATAPVNGTTKYVIEDIKPFGTDRTPMGVIGGGTEGFATSGSTTTLVDTNKNWELNYWSRTAQRYVRIVEGTGVGTEIAITSNTATTLTFAAQAFTVDTTTRYVIMDTFGTATAGSTTVLTDTTKNWGVNQFTNKRVRFLSGTSQGNEYIITANTANTLTYALGTAPDVSTAYAILEATPKANGIHLDCIHNSSNTALNNKYMYAWTGTATSELSRYDINTEHWERISYFPQTETMTTGASYCYDGVDRIYFVQGITTTAKVMYYDLVKNIVVPSSQFPYGMGAAVSGNRMEIIETDDGLKYLYLMRNTGTEMWRTLLYW